MAVLPICQHCEKQWTYRQSLKNMIILRCPVCQNKNHVRKFRIRDVIFSLTFSVIVLFIFPMLKMPIGGTIVFAFLSLSVFVLTYPINLKLTKDEEPYF